MRCDSVNTLATCKIVVVFFAVICERQTDKNKDSNCLDNLISAYSEKLRTHALLPL